MNAFIHCEEVTRRLEAASILNQNVYISGATGYGKTRIVKEFLADRSYEYYSCNLTLDDQSEDGLEDLLSFHGESMTVVIDDLQDLVNDEERKKVLACLKEKRFWVILISRGDIPDWLFSLSVEQRFMLIPEEYFYVKEKSFRRYLEEISLSLKDEQIQQVLNLSNCYPMVLCYFIQLLKSGKDLDQNTIYQVRRLFHAHLQKAVIDHWPIELTRFMAAMSILDEFSVDQAIMMTGNPLAHELIGRCMEIGTFLNSENGHYRIRKQLADVFHENMEQYFSAQEVKEFFFLAGRYLETVKEDLKALELYARYDMQPQIHSLLVRNSKKTPDIGFYYEMRKYYYMLSNEEISQDVYLMSGMSMLSCICMDVETSDFWYQALKEYQKNSTGLAHREATIQLVYLDIGLPQRGTVDILDLIQAASVLFREKSLAFPEFSVTGNVPSLMNGGKDFCDWSKKDFFIAGTYGKLVSTFLGKYGKGLVSTALAESSYEKGSDLQMVWNLISKAKIEQSGDAKSQMKFALLGTQVRAALANGEFEMGRELILSFIKGNQDNQKFLPNLEALKCRYYLLIGDIEKIQQFLDSSFNENESFCTLFRYVFMVRIRCYLALKQYEKAGFLIQTMRHYAKQYDRTYIEMETDLLDTILLYRQGKNWEDQMVTALAHFAEYHFVRTIAEECGAVYGLLEKIQNRFLSEYPQYEEWFSLVYRECGKMARRYKKYMNIEKEISRIEISPFDVRVLSCLADGMSISETAAALKINFETLRSRLKEIYKRLGAKNKTEAILIAQSLNVI